MTLRSQTVRGVTVLNAPIAGALAAVNAAGLLATHLPGEVAVVLSEPPAPQAPAVVEVPVQVAEVPAPVKAVKGQFTRPSGEVFYPRSITFGDRATTDVQLLRDWVAAGMSPFLVGAPGCGKTGAIEAALWNWEGSHGFEVLIGTANTEVADFRGSYVPQPDGTFRWIDGPLTRAARDGKILYVDEIGRIDSKVLTCLYEVMDGRGVMEIPENPSLGTIKVQPGFAVVGSTNPDAPGCVMDDALLSRFMAPVEYTTDWGIVTKHLGVPREVAALGREMTKAVKAGTAYWAPTTRDALQWKTLEAVSGALAAWQGLLTAAPVEARPDVAASIERATGLKLAATGWSM